MNSDHEDRMKQLLKQALPPISEAEPSRDLWPELLRRLDARPAAPPWFDWALAGGLVAFAAFIPTSIPVILYYF